MVELSKVKRVYFLGIGGIGMSALARWFKANDYEVAGYDKTPSPLTDALQEEGIAVLFDEELSAIPGAFREVTEELLVVYTPAIPAHHPQLCYFQQEKAQLHKRSQVLGFLTQDMFTVAIAGTHGKTTTSSMVAHLLKHGGIDVTAFLGGITKNYNSNLLLNEGPRDKAVVVVEADEYDRSFLTLSPDIAVITSMDPDHLDIYDTPEVYSQGFKDFVGKLGADGVCWLNSQVDQDYLSEGKTIRFNKYGLNELGCGAENVRVDDGEQVFDVRTPIGLIKDLRLSVPGWHNIDNATAAIAVAVELGLEAEVIREGISTYGGVKRRFEYVLKDENQVLIDDYAHHPSEITSFLRSARSLFPDKYLRVIFQPHLFSRTRDFLDEFAESLALADEVYLLEIYPARELPIEDITSSVLLDKIPMDKKSLVGKEEFLALAKEFEGGVTAVLGAGDIDRLVQPLKGLLELKTYAG